MGSEVKELKCSRCGGSAKCYHQDVGGVEYYDEYVLYCFKCGLIERAMKYGGSPMSDNWGTDCPYCGVDCFSHEATPPRLCGYSTRYLPIFKFKMGKREIWIVIYASAATKEQIMLVSDPNGYTGLLVPLDLPVPHMEGEISEVDENKYHLYHSDELKLDFKVNQSDENQAEIEVSISGPPAFAKRKKLTIKRSADMKSIICQTVEIN